MPNRPTPRDLGIPHNEWRENQYAMYQKAQRFEGKPLFAELSTGSGKSALAVALGHESQVLVLVHTLALLTQYEEAYGFSVVRGRQEYPCAVPAKNQIWKDKYGYEPTAADCHCDPMHECPMAKSCKYLQAKHIAVSAQRSACTYRYAGVSSLMKKRSGHIVLDEAHDSVEELIGFNEFIITFKTILYYNFGVPIFDIEEGGEIMSPEVKSNVLEWLNECIIELANKIEKFDKEERKERYAASAIRTFNKFARLFESLYEHEWFIEIDEERLIIRALDAKQTAKQIFANKKTKLMMSATLGNPHALAESLDLKHYETFTFPHPVPSVYRMVKKINMPRMTKYNLDKNPNYYELQAERIHKWFSGLPPEWRGVIVTSSYYKVSQLEEHLSKRVGNRRLIVQQKGMKVGDTVGKFIRDVQDGDIMIGTIQGMGTGLDLYGDLARWIVVAGVPFVNPTDKYSKARRQVFGSGKYEKWVTYNAVMQACGRVSRGEQDENGLWIPNYAALADGSAVSPTAVKYYSDWFTEAMI